MKLSFQEGSLSLFHLLFPLLSFILVSFQIDAQNSTYDQEKVKEKVKVKEKERIVTEEVQAAVLRLFDAMRASDGEALAGLFTDSAQLQTIAFSGNGAPVIRSSSVEQFVSAVSKSKKGALDERITFGGIHVDGVLASVWTPYKFFYDNNFSHCGANSFQLVFINGQWKIHYLIDTRRKTDCE